MAHRIASFDEVLDYWLGPAPNAPSTLAERSARWFRKSEQTDQEIRERFGATLEAAASAPPPGWPDTPRARVAEIIVLDQFSRNIHRDTPAMYATDARALALTRAMLDAGEDEPLAFFERVFTWMPLMHAEDPVAQAECCRRFAALAAGHTGPLGDYANNAHGYALRHKEIVDRFGRFPHRNAILGRPTTAEEAEFLREPGSSF